MERKPYIDIDGNPYRIDEIMPDLIAMKQVPVAALQVEEKLGEVPRII